MFNFGWFEYAMMMEALFVLTVIYSIREFIIERIYGVRFKRWLILDTGQTGYGILNKALNEWEVLGQKRAVTYSLVNKGWVYYTHDNAQNLKLAQTELKHDNYTLYTAYCNTTEYNTNIKTKIFQQLLYVLEKNWIIVIAVLAGATLVVSLYSIYHMQQTDATINWIAWKVNQTYGAGNTIRVR